VSAYHEFNKLLEALRARRAHGGPSWTAEERQLLREHHEGAERHWRKGETFSDGILDIPARPRPWGLIELEFGPPVKSVLEGPDARSFDHPPGQPPDPIPLEIVRALDPLLRERLAAGKPHRGPLTQTRIAERVGLPDWRVAQAQVLIEIGWELQRTHPEFSGVPGAVRWPTIEKAVEILAFERSRGKL
jgi:hypothetical protein